MNCQREEIVSFLDHHKTNRFVTRCDALKEWRGQFGFEDGGIVQKRAGVLLCADGKMIFWELLADNKLFLEDEKGASCLLEK